MDIKLENFATELQMREALATLQGLTYPPGVLTPERPEVNNVLRGGAKVRYTRYENNRATVQVLGKVEHSVTVLFTGFKAFPDIVEAIGVVMRSLAVTARGRDTELDVTRLDGSTFKVHVFKKLCENYLVVERL
tara:strand:- start:32 stop:433 length:402 start_codon:yes stop_codon:yes gene_type:complete